MGEEGLREELAERGQQIQHLTRVNSEKGKVLVQKNEGIRSLNSKIVSNQEMGVSSIEECEWEEASGLTTNTSSTCFDLRKDPLKRCGEKSLAWERKANHSMSKQGNNRGDLETRQLNVSFSDEAENSLLPTQTLDKLSRKLEKMYVDQYNTGRPLIQLDRNKVQRKWSVAQATTREITPTVLSDYIS